MVKACIAGILEVKQPKLIQRAEQQNAILIGIFSSFFSAMLSQTCWFVICFKCIKKLRIG